MEHEVFVPAPAEQLRTALADPARVARAIPGLQRDADAASPPLSGRLKVRIGGHSITYRGTLRVAAHDDGSFAIEGEGTEVRGPGGVSVSLTVRVTEAELGSSVAFSGTASADGRAAESSPQAVEGAVRRLLDRFAEGLGSTTAPTAPAEPELPEAPEITEVLEELADSSNPSAPSDPEDVTGPSVFDTEVPPPSLDPLTDEDAVPAEAAHARRTMIGRSAEEVDHAPPRGRYAPMPVAETTSTTATLRWAAPVAALAVASLIVAGRALRRRR